MEILNVHGNEIKGEWIKCKKKSYVIEACKVSEATRIFNPLERSDVEVNKGEIILRGLLGEVWVIAESKFEERYTDLDGNSLTTIVQKDSFEWTKVATKASDAIYYALRIPREKECGLYGMKTERSEEAKYFNEKGEMFRTVFEINSKDSISDHGKGDCLMCMAKSDGTPDCDDIWVVDGYLFEKTYTIF